MVDLVAAFVGGLLLLVAGGEALVRGAAAIARAFGVPHVVIGLTVVAFGTSAPEFVVGLTGAATGEGGVVFGNVVGATILNLTLILGITALLHPLAVERTLVTREIPMLLLAACVALALTADAWFDAPPDRLTRGDGLVLCLLFCVVLYYTIRALRRNRDDPLVKDARKLSWQLRLKSLGLPIGLFVVGLAGLGSGGYLLVDAAVGIAGAAGMSPAAIGMTVVAVGTTLPELATSVIAARKGQSDLAVGNVVGSNIFNLLLVMGVTTSIQPIDVPPRGAISLAVSAGVTLVFLCMILLGDRRIGRRHALVLLTTFGAYIAWVLLAAPAS